MLRKIMLLTVFAISLMSCDDDFKQGSCDEGFYEQTQGAGSTMCVPITDIEGVDKTMTDVENLNTTD